MTQVEFSDDIPEGYTQQQWTNESCCACYGCPDCDHQCNYSDEERARHIASVEEAFKNLVPVDQLEPRPKFTKIIIPPGLAHIDYEKEPQPEG